MQEAIERGSIGDDRCQGFPNDPYHHSKADKHGHGTYVASVLLKTAPDVSLYIARVFNDVGRLCDGDHDDYSEIAKVNTSQKLSKSDRLSTGPLNIMSI